MNLSQTKWAVGIANDNSAVIIDVRTSEEFEEGYIEKAINIDILDASNFAEEINKLDKLGKYYIYCKAGTRSGNACNIMEHFGFNFTYNLEGGILEWKGEILSI